MKNTKLIPSASLENIYGNHRDKRIREIRARMAKYGKTKHGIYDP